jgi:dihydrofolate reductase
MILSIVVAFSENGVIGYMGKVPWKLSADLKRFKALTMGHAVIMGRKTFESIGKPLIGRLNIILTTQINYRASGCVVVHSPEEALDIAEIFNRNEAFVIGGEKIYRLMFPKTDRIYLTQVHTDCEGDAFFPETSLDPTKWRYISSEFHPPDQKNQFAQTFTLYERVGHE